MYLLRPYLVTTETFVDRRSRSAPLGMVYATLENAPDQWKMAANWRRCAALLQFWWTETDTSIQFAWIPCISIKSLTIAFHIIRQQVLFCKLQTTCCFKFQPGHFFAPLNIGRIHTEMHFLSQLAKALQHFFFEKLLWWAILEKYRRCCLYFVWLLLLSCFLARKQLYTFLYDFTPEQSHPWYVWLILLRKCCK